MEVSQIYMYKFNCKYGPGSEILEFTADYVWVDNINVTSVTMVVQILLI